MSPILNNQYSSLFPLQGNQQDQTHLIPFFPPYETPPFQYPITHRRDHHLPLKVEEHMPHGGPNDPLILRMTPTANNHKDDDDNNNKHNQKKINDRLVTDNSRNETVKWMSSKMRIMRKMMNSNSPQAQLSATGESSSGNSNSSSSGSIRVCSDCNTTKTPLWRTGPQGPKSLCNACGIRQRKARKAMAAAALNDKYNATDVPTSSKSMKEKGSTSRSSIVPYKKRFRYKLELPSKKIGLEDFGISLKQSSAFHPQDEKEAAILLMALSCDLIFG